MVVSEAADGTYQREIAERSVDDLPPGEILIRVQYSSLNYKDALSAVGNKGVTKKYPHTPGVDAAGVVEESAVDFIKPGDEVVVTGYDLGMNTAGGFGEYVRVPADWIVKKPAGLTLRESMIYGTAGFTAALSVYKLTSNGVAPDQGEVLVTGAPGGVGSIALSILAKMGFDVVAVNGVVDQTEYLTGLGAKRVIGPDEATDTSSRPLLKGLWAGAVDTVGGDILATAIKTVNYGGTVTCCGNAASHELPINVYPFILRGVSLLGIDSVNCPTAVRLPIWDKLATEWKLDHLETIADEIGMDDLNERIELILQGKNRGRAIVSLSK
jgi:putative YhdH/YhfP family quinone oxidoreductase